MNRTQKTALCHLVVVLLTLAMLAYIFFQLFVLKKTPEGGRLLKLIILILLFLLYGSLIVWSLKRQSPKEPEADERDKLITTRAAMAAFISAWIVLPAVSVIPQTIFGDDGCIPAWSLPLIIFGALLILMMIYSAAILVQYFFRSGDGNK